MSVENKNTNLPSVTVTGMVRELAELYQSADRMGTPFRLVPTPFLWGPAGIGKSEGVRQLAEGLRRRTGKKVAVTDVRLLLYSPVDLRGVPVADANRQFTNWLKPRVFDMPEGRDTINLLFLDELSAAPQSVQAAAYQICLDRTVGEHRLPENCIVIAAGNRTTDQSVAYKMPKALCNRLMHFEIRTDFESWREWAVQNGVDSRVVGYLSFNNDKLCLEPESSDIAYPTPRSWVFVSTLLGVTKRQPAELHQLISGCVGTDTAVEFEAWCKNNSDMPPVADIIAGRCRIYPKRQDTLYALSSSLVAAVRERAERISGQELENVCAYASRFPPDFAFPFFKDLNCLETLKLKLMKCSSFQIWIARNKRYL